jgi:spore coat polysaccharide biosynthesis protein SpsF
MTIGIIVLCRYSSSRLPGKILKEINHKPVLEYILERLNSVTKATTIVVATSDQPSDDPIADYCESVNVNCYRGSLENVSQRFLDCSDHFQMDYAVRVNGDNLFTDPKLVDQGIELAILKSADFVTNVKDRTFPTGMSVEVVKTNFYRDQISEFSDDTFREHVTLYFYEHPEKGLIEYFYNKEFNPGKGFKLAIDSMEDFNFATQIFNRMERPHTEYDWKEIVNIAKSLK